MREIVVIKDVGLLLWIFLKTIILFYIGMFLANIMVSLTSIGLDVVGIWLTLMAETSWFWDFIATVIDSGWIYFALSYTVFLKTLDRSLDVCDSNSKCMLIVALISIFIIIIYDIDHFDISLFGIADFLRNHMGFEIWKSFDYFNMTTNISTMRYFVFDLAVFLGGVVCVYDN